MKLKFNRIAICALLSAIVAIMAVACGPGIKVVDVDVRVPSKTTLDLSDKVISVFFAVRPCKEGGSDLSKLSNDSLLLYSVSDGIAGYLEDYYGLKEGSVAVYSYSPNDAEQKGNAYYKALCRESLSSVVFMVDSLNFEDLTGSSSPNYYYSMMTITGRMVDSCAQVIPIEKKDTVYCEIISKNDLNQAVLIPRAKEYLKEYLIKEGTMIAENYSGRWGHEQRYIYTYPNSVWANATEYALDFKWKDAADLWMGETMSDNDRIAACAAFNLAVAAEMSNRLDLALRWLDFSIKRYKLPEVAEYAKKLKSKVETGKETGQKK